MVSVSVKEKKLTPRKESDEMGHGHFIKICKCCGEVIAQCRCMDMNKKKEYGICMKCKTKKEMFLTNNHKKKGGAA